jgi:hypothetical protein
MSPCLSRFLRIGAVIACLFGVFPALAGAAANVGQRDLSRPTSGSRDPGDRDAASMSTSPARVSRANAASVRLRCGVRASQSSARPSDGSCDTCTGDEGRRPAYGCASAW